MIKCMIAEDFQPLREVFDMLISYEKDMKVIGSFSSGEAIYKEVALRQPDVILMDVEMEEPHSGLKYSKKILERYPEIKIIILTCHEEEDVILEAYSYGVCDYVLKEKGSTEMLEAIRSAYNKNSPIRPYAADVIRKSVVSHADYKKSILTIVNIISNLTQSEMEIIKLLLTNKKQFEIAKTRQVELVTVKYHISSILKKFNCKRSTEVVKIIKTLALEDFFN